MIFSTIDKQLIMLKPFCLLKRLWFYLVFKFLAYLIKYSKWRNQKCVLMLQSRGTRVLQGLKDDQENRYNGDGDFIKPLPCHRLQNMHKYP